MFKTDRAPELVRYADAIVVAALVARHPGRLATAETGEDTLPFQIVEFRVHRTIKGVESADRRIYVERAGGYDPVDQIEVEIDLDGGNFEDGGSYLLFLKEQPDTGMYYQINDQARYQVVDGRLKAFEPDEDPVQRDERAAGKPA